jgi:diketogulonate reductase-like aldo/keto reductase
VSNFNLKLLQKSAALSETPLLTDQVSYSIPDRTYEENGVLDYCQQNGILLTAYSPIKRRNIKSNPKLKEIALARRVTPEQIALAWLTSQPQVITIPMSFIPQHQAENLSAADLVLSAAEMALLA